MTHTPVPTFLHPGLRSDRLNRTQEVAGSIPVGSTIKPTCSSQPSVFNNDSCRWIEPSTDVGGFRGQSPLRMERDGRPAPSGLISFSRVLIVVSFR